MFVKLILKYFKQVPVIFIFFVFVWLNVNHSRDVPLDSNERSSIVYVSLRGGDGKTQRTTFVTTLPDAPTSPGLPALPDPKSIGEQSIDIQGIKEISPEFGYKTAFAGAGGKKFKITLTRGMVIRNIVKNNRKKIKGVI